ncbi:hypothetical protein GOP47_0011663 [Adiantum capillus-veneris]|uniref:C2 domain-containing protein n=1 Tax=Adiantum capillus-veneris TaxID=13818 RepID=A0A9D4UT70_ADICA|nr:hypothetical protein GOP47_0011663 [Adiantum capillus-veneris]
MGQQGLYLDLTILSASDLKRGWLSGDQTVAIAWINPSSKSSTEVASGGGLNAQWNEKLTLPLSDAIERHGKWLTIEIRSSGALGGGSLLGTANVPLAEVALDTQKEANSTQTYQLVLPSGKRFGSVSFLGKIVKPRATINSSAALPSAPPASLLNAYDAGPRANVLYPPPISYSSDETSGQKPSPVHSTYPPSVGVSPQNLTTGKFDDFYHRESSTYTSCGLASRPLQLYPSCRPQYYPPASCAPCAYVECATAPYPPQLSSAPYPPHPSMYQHSDPPVPYPPRFVYPPAPHYLETPYPPPAFYPYAAQSSPLYPPPYTPQHAPPSFVGPHPAF